MHSRILLPIFLAGAWLGAQGLHAQTSPAAPAAPAPAPAPAQTLPTTVAPSDPQMDADLQEIITKVKGGDMASVVDKMYTPFIKMAGGADAVKAQTKQIQAAMAQQGLKIDTFDVLKPITMVATSVREYRIIPIDSIMEANAKKVEVKSYWLAIRDVGGKDWQYLDGEGLSKMPALKDQFFPDLKATKFPDVDAKVIN